jgi:diketogulonate reductase-like aldo/keto reductase
MKTMRLGDQHVPVLGMGTWHMGETSTARSAEEAASLQFGLDNGLSVIDTAEMYGEGAAERVVGRAIAGRQRADIYLISKFYPWHATDSEIRRALTRSLTRLGTDYLDMYLLHWRGTTPLTETIGTLRDLQNEGLIRSYGVSNFDTVDLKEARAVRGGKGVVANEVLYNLAARGIEYDLMPQQEQAGVSLIGYSPFGSGDGRSIELPQELVELAQARSLTGHQLMLAWALRSGRVLSIPKAGTPAHMRENIEAAEVELDDNELALIDAFFPAPQEKVPLAEI